MIVPAPEILEPVQLALELRVHGFLRRGDQGGHFLGGRCARFLEHGRKQLAFHGAFVEQLENVAFLQAPLPEVWSLGDILELVVDDGSHGRGGQEPVHVQRGGRHAFDHRIRLQQDGFLPGPLPDAEAGVAGFGAEQLIKRALNHGMVAAHKTHVFPA